MSIQKANGLISIVALLFSGMAIGQTQVPNDFTAGQPARAAEVNANFDALETAVDQNTAAIQQIPAGPQGEPGPQGIQGAQGDVGPQGPAGIVEAGSVGLAEIDPTQVQIRVGGSCTGGSFIASIGQDGSVTCGDGGDTQRNTIYGEGAGASYSPIGGGGGQNTAIGWQTLNQNSDFSRNTAIGYAAMQLSTAGANNTAVGSLALLENRGADNTAIGNDAMRFNTTGQLNTAGGVSSLLLNSAGNSNTANGALALLSNSSGSGNTAMGHQSLLNNETGNNNIAIGQYAGSLLNTGDFNIAIGNDGGAGDSFTTRIGTSQTRAFVAGIRGATTSFADAITVVVDSNGQLGTISSSRRYKQDIDDMGLASDRLLQLRPVTFRYEEPYENGEKPLEYGLIAEEVAEVFPELVVFNKENQAETVKYRVLSSLLLNELQKQNTTLKNQAVQLASLNAQVAEIAELKAQVAELGKLVSQVAQLNRPVSGLVATNAMD